MKRIKTIAECGCNWNSLEQAKEMINHSKEVGCWASKFQLFTKSEALDLPEYLYLSFEQARELFEYGKSIKQEVFFTPMYLEAVDFLEELEINYYKIRHKDRYNTKLVRKIKSTNKPFFISFDFFDFHHYQSILHDGMQLLCIPKYPASFEDYKNIITFGYSDHTPDLRLFNYANRNGALYFEKHVCLTKNCLESEWSVTFEELEGVINNKR